MKLFELLLYILWLKHQNIGKELNEKKIISKKGLNCFRTEKMWWNVEKQNQQKNKGKGNVIFGKGFTKAECEQLDVKATGLKIN